METHVKVLGVLHIVAGGLGVIAAVLIVAILGGVAGLVEASADAPDAQTAIPILKMVSAGLFVFLLLISAPGIVAGIGLLHFRNWARILTIVLSALQLMNLPFGTALGIYGLWVLLSQRTEPLFRTAGATR